MKTFIELNREGNVVHEKMQCLIDLQSEIVKEEYETISQILGAISSKLDDMLLDSKAIREQMEAVINE